MDVSLLEEDGIKTMIDLNMTTTIKMVGELVTDVVDSHYMQYQEIRVSLGYFI